MLKISARLDIADDLTIGSRNDEPKLNEIFQKIVKSIDRAKVRAILNKWISVKESVAFNYTLLWEVSLIVLFIFLIILFYTYKLKQSNQKLVKISRLDVLTDIGNRLQLNEILDYEYKYTNRYGIPCGVILIDIDDFKRVNDNYGHLEGDEVLKKFASVLLSNIRETDKIGRWGGEEFLIICANTNMENLQKVAESLRKKIEECNFGENVQNITASFGLSVFDGIKSIEDVLNEADRRLYLAKNSGKNRIN